MRVLIVSDVTGYMRGGVPTATRHLIDGLVSRGHEVGFCGDIPLPTREPFSFFEARIFEPKQLALRVSEAIASFRPDVVHLNSMSSKALLETIPGLRGRPWVLTCHSIPPYERKVAHFHANESLHYGLRWLRFVANTVAWRYLFLRRDIPRVIVHSEWVRRIVLRYGYPDERTAVIPLGFEAPAPDRVPERPAPSKTDGPLLLTVGGVAHTKGQHDAVAAVAKLRPAFPNIQYRIVGEIRDPGYLHWLTGLVERLGLRSNIQILEALPEADKQRLVDAADVYLQPSHEEGFCLAFLEAAFCVPRLVATDAGAMRSVCGTDRAARVVAIRDPDAIAEAVESVLSVPVDPALLSDRRRRLAAAFDWEAFAESHERLYGELVAPHDRRAPRPATGQ